MLLNYTGNLNCPQNTTANLFRIKQSFVSMGIKAAVSIVVWRDRFRRGVEIYRKSTDVSPLFAVGI